MPTNAEGEIVVSGDAVGAYCGTSGGAAALRTGDLGYLSNDGELFVVGRRSAFLKNRGFRISPELVESVIGSHPGIEDCRVVMRESRLVAELVCRDLPSSLSALHAHVTRSLPSYCVPDELVAVPAIPRTRSGKVKRY